MENHEKVQFACYVAFEEDQIAITLARSGNF